jgi:Asp-tRNA(Asn)/Glu-tRNA(Gln) amidotransferase A subunit family amidase
MTHGAGEAATVDPADLGVLGAAALLRDGQLSAAELTGACLRRIEERNGGPPTHDGTPAAINAWVRIYPELAREQARGADERRQREGAATPLLCGIPLALERMTIALTDRTAGLAVETDVATGLDAARRACESLGARVIELPAPWTLDWDDLSRVLLTEVWAHHVQHAARHHLHRPSIAELSRQPPTSPTRRPTSARRSAGPTAQPSGRSGFAFTTWISCSSPRCRSCPTSAARAMTAATRAAPAIP